MSRYRFFCLALVIAAIITYALAISVRPMVAPDEFRYGEIPREMLDSGNWTAPHLNGLPYYEKPVLGYWATAISMAVFGQNPFAVRLPFAVATLASGLIIFNLVKRFGPGKWVALFAAAIYLTSVQVAFMGTYAILDPLLSLWLTMALATFFIATECPSNSWHRHRYLMLCGLACGLAFLTKGFLAFAVAACVAGPYLVWGKRFRELFTLPVTPIIFTAVIAAPWSIAVHLADGDFWHYFFVIEHLKRFSGGDEAQHASPLWFYIPIILAGALPWTPFAPQMFRRVDCAYRPLMRWSICWFIFPVLFFSAASGKLPTYILPCFAPLSIILAITLASLSPCGLLGHLTRFSRGFAFLCLVAGPALAIQLLFNPLNLEQIHTADEAWKGVFAALLLITAGVIFLLARRDTRIPVHVASITAAMFLVIVTVAVVFPANLGYKTPGIFLDSYLQAIPDDAILVADATVVHAVCWKLERNDAYILRAPGELWYGLSREEFQHRLLQDSDFAAILNDENRIQPIVVINHPNWFDETKYRAADYQSSQTNIAIQIYFP